METRNTNAETVIVSSHLLQSERLLNQSIPNARTVEKPLLFGTDMIPKPSIYTLIDFLTSSLKLHSLALVAGASYSL